MSAAEELVGLEDLLHSLFPCGDVSDLDAPPCWTAAQTVLASDWLAQRDATQRAEAAQAVLDAVRDVVVDRRYDANRATRALAAARAAADRIGGTP